jgi:transposase
VVNAHCKLTMVNPTKAPSTREVAVEARVSHKYASRVVAEFRKKGCVEDPALGSLALRDKHKLYRKLGPEESLFLLACRAEDDRRPLYKYVELLQDEMDYRVLHQTIDNCFKKRFDHRGSLRKSSFVPLDKYKPENLERCAEFFRLLEKLPDHFKYHWIDEKHVVNHHCVQDRIRADPLTGRVRCINVTGDFREAYNLIAIISSNTTKTNPVYWIVGEENGNACSYVAFLEHLIAIRWFERGDVLIRDRAAIHDKAEADVAADMLWNTIVDGQPLNVVDLALPARAPELNPIELVFHILARRLKSYKYRVSKPADATVPDQVGRVLSELTLETVLKCAAHCGY